jgi:excisionase family DNA binding protein
MCYNFDMQTNLLTVEEAALKLKRSKSAVYRAVRKNKIAYVKRFGIVLIPVTAITKSKKDVEIGDTDMLSIPEAAALIDTSVGAIRNAIRCGRIEAIPVCGRLVIERAAALEYKHRTQSYWDRKPAGRPRCSPDRKSG